MPALNTPLLTHLSGYWDGAFQEVQGPILSVHDPASGAVIATLPELTAAHATLAVDAAARALAAPAPDLHTRRRVLTAVADAHDAHIDDLARIITAENGKPIAQARGEVRYAAAFYRDAIGQLDRLATRTLPERHNGLTWQVHARPAGVAALITPFNFPLAMLAKKLAAAIAGGCPAVVKPAETTPLSVVALFHLLHGLDLPPGAVNLVFGQPEPIGRVLCEHPAVRIVSFTGSTRVGQWLAATAGPHMKRLSLELGGNAPFIVFADTDLDHAADQLVSNKLRSAGQTCVCANRVLVEAPVMEAFADKLAARVRTLRVGPGMDATSDVGPLIHRTAFDKVQAHVADALAGGARALVGGPAQEPEGRWGAYFPPTVLVGVRRDCLAYREETFGPLFTLASFADEDDAVQLAEATTYGLAAYVFSSDAARLQRMAARLHFGHVGLNTGSGPTPQAPFGGMRMSGIGREGGEEGVVEFVEWQTTPMA